MCPRGLLQFCGVGKLGRVPHSGDQTVEGLHKGALAGMGKPRTSPSVWQWQILSDVSKEGQEWASAGWNVCPAISPALDQVLHPVDWHKLPGDFLLPSFLGVP